MILLVNGDFSISLYGFLRSSSASTGPFPLSFPLLLSTSSPKVRRISVINVPAFSLCCLMRVSSEEIWFRIWSCKLGDCSGVVGSGVGRVILNSRQFRNKGTTHLCVVRDRIKLGLWDEDNLHRSAFPVSSSGYVTLFSKCVGTCSPAMYSGVCSPAYGDVRHNVSAHGPFVTGGAISKRKPHGAGPTSWAVLSALVVKPTFGSVLERGHIVCAANQEAEEAFKKTVEVDRLIDALKNASDQELQKLVVENILAYNESFWMRLAARTDTYLEELASSIMNIVDRVVHKTNEKIESATDVLKGILRPVVSEVEEICWPPRDPNAINLMEKVWFATINFLFLFSL
ncbi:hypothetical protein Tco_0608366 [Tanacetum coccineum]